MDLLQNYRTPEIQYTTLLSKNNILCNIFDVKNPLLEFVCVLILLTISWIIFWKKSGLPLSDGEGTRTCSPVWNIIIIGHLEV